MTVLILGLTYMTGTLPPSWGDGPSFPSLMALEIGAGALEISHLSGSLPPEWSTPTAFPQLQTLSIGNCSINGQSVQLPR